jgi:hypothetical protein
MELLDCPIDDLVENDWNPNKMPQIRFDALVESMRVHPELIEADRLVVRTKGKKWEILGGAHRFRAARMNGFKKVPVGDLGVINDAEAKLISLILNNHGEADFDKKLDVIHSIKAQISLNDIANRIGENYNTLNTLITDMELKTDGLQKVMSDISSDDEPSPDSALAAILGNPAGQTTQPETPYEQDIPNANANPQTTGQLNVPEDMILHVSGSIHDAIVLGDSLGHTSIESTISMACEQFVRNYNHQEDITL